MPAAFPILARANLARPGPAVYRPQMVAHLRLTLDERLFGAAALAATVEAGDDVPTTIIGRIAALARAAVSPLSHVLNMAPVAASVELPGHRQAGTFALTFAWRDLPLDPRAIRSVGVELHLGTVSDEKFARGASGAPLGRLETIGLGGEPNPDTLLLVGVADTISAAHDTSGGTLRLEGRDLRGLFLDTPVGRDTLAEVDLRQPVHVCVKELLCKHPFGPGLQIAVNPSEWPGGVVPAPHAAPPRARRSAAGKPRKPPPDEKASYWDVVTDWCASVAAVPFFAGQRLVIRPARSLGLGTVFDPARPTPFRGGRERLVGGERLRVRRLVYGRDLEELTLERKLSGGIKVPIIEVVAVDTASDLRGADKMLTVRWPRDMEMAGVQVRRGAGVIERAERTSVHGVRSAREVLRVPIAGYRDSAVLAQIARALYEEIGRGEMGGTAKTSDLASQGGGNDDPDLLRLRPGDAIELAVDVSGLGSRPPPVSELQNLGAMSDAAAIAALMSRGIDSRLASALVVTSRGGSAALQRLFRVGSVRYDYDQGRVGIGFDFANYVIAAYDAEAPAPTGAVPRVGAPTREVLTC